MKGYRCKECVTAWFSGGVALRVRTRILTPNLPPCKRGGCSPRTAVTVPAQLGSPVDTLIFADIAPEACCEIDEAAACWIRAASLSAPDGPVVVAVRKLLEGDATFVQAVPSARNLTAVRGPADFRLTGTSPQPEL